MKCNFCLYIFKCACLVNYLVEHRLSQFVRFARRLLLQFELNLLSFVLNKLEINIVFTSNFLKLLKLF